MFFSNHPRQDRFPKNYTAHRLRPQDAVHHPNSMKIAVNPSVYPPVNPDTLYESANESSKLMKDASLLLDKLATSKDYGKQLMDHAQRSENAEVSRMIKSIGLSSEVKVSYNPDSIRIQLKSNSAEMMITLRWR